jgi:glycerol-3-phosphate acyltransferase PlsX
MSHPATGASGTRHVAQAESGSSPASSPQARIVLDAAGGDSPLAERLAGAVEAARLYPDIEVILCGPSERMDAEMAGSGVPPDNVRLVDAPEHIAMHESPVQALRDKRRSSIVVGVEMVAAGEADAFVSAGNTGAVAAASTLKLGRLKGVQRPGIAAAMRVIDQTVVAIDVGANVSAKPVHLLQYGIMASVFARRVLRMENPRVGLLNVGQEEAKGNEVARQAFEMLAASELNFVGNTEPEGLVNDACDVIVCDGFVGNVMLKMGEGLVTKLVRWMRAQIPRRLRYKIGFWLCKDLLRHLKSIADYSEYGGAPLLGVAGVTIITHGTSDARAICNAVREARAFVRLKVNDQIEEAILQDAAARRRA